MSASQFASFAAYTPPPDEHTVPAPKSSRSAWFQNYDAESSYQSGGIPTFDSARSDGSIAVAEEETPTNQWETTFGWRMDILASVAYFVGPISALLLLIYETQNDYVRFHAYQSALLTTPLVFVRIFLSIVQFPSSIKTIYTVVIFAVQIFAGSYRAYIDAARDNPIPFHVPYIGKIAETWLAEE